MAKLSSCQTNAANIVQFWWDNRDAKKRNFNMILDGPGGTGKSYLVKYLLNNLKKVSPLLLAPTNEALFQLEEKTGPKYKYLTVYKALGLRPNTSERDLKFETFRLPQLWQDYNLAVVDEVSQLSKWEIDLLLNIGIPILWVGHESQLPPVDNTRLTTDLCKSPIFGYGFPKVTLETPMRNAGKLWHFTQYCEQQIYDPTLPDDTSFDVLTAPLKEYLYSDVGRNDFTSGEAKIVAWTNASVEKYNGIVRELLFGDKAKLQRYLPGDRVIFTSPTTSVDMLLTVNEREYLRDADKGKLAVVTTNSKGTVLCCDVVRVHWKKDFHIDCYVVTVAMREGELTFLDPVELADVTRVAELYERQAWAASTQKARESCYKKRNLVMSLFGGVAIKNKQHIPSRNIRHFYAGTSYRLQGSSIEKVIVINSDIARCPNRVESAKHRYVAVSRASKQLMVYRGVSV